jgi:PST family polysaccharide transporter
VYGVQFANYVLPLLTVPYLSRVLGPRSWGLVAIAQSFAMYGHLLVEYGFVYSGTREIATASSPGDIDATIAAVSTAKALLSGVMLASAMVAYIWMPLFHANGLLLWTAVLSELLKALLPVYYFYGTKQVAIASFIDVAARLASAAGVFVFIHKPDDAWIFFLLQGIGAGVALVVSHAMILSKHRLRFACLRDGIKMLHEAGAMFLFRSAHNIYVMGNAFILGLFAPPQAVGFYAGAEKISSAAVGLLSPVSTALYPHAAGLVKSSMRRAARLTAVSLYAVLGASVGLTLLMWFGAPLIVRVLLGPKFAASIGVLQILAFRAPFVAWTTVLGFQWLLALGLEKTFQKVTIAAFITNVVLAFCLAPRFAFNGMAFVAVLSQATAAAALYFALTKRGLNPITLQSDSSYA